MRRIELVAVSVIVALSALFTIQDSTVVQGQAGATYVYSFYQTNSAAGWAIRSAVAPCVYGTFQGNSFVDLKNNCGGTIANRLLFHRNYATAFTVTQVRVYYNLSVAMTLGSGFFNGYSQIDEGGSRNCNSGAFDGSVGQHDITLAITCTSIKDIFFNIQLVSASSNIINIYEIDLWTTGTIPETLTPSPTATNTPTNTPTKTNTPTATYTASNTPTITNTPTNTPIPPTATNTPTDTPIPPTATNTPTDTPIPPTATNTPTDTPIPPTATNTPTDTPIPTDTAIPSDTPVPADTDTPIPTNTAIPSDTPVPADTETPTNTPTAPAVSPAPTETSTPIDTAIPSETPTPTVSPTPSPDVILIVILPSGRPAALSYTITAGRLLIIGELALVVLLLSVRLYLQLRKNE